MCSLRDANEKLQKKGVKVYGVSFDTVDAQKTFVEKQKLPFDLLADIDGTVIKAFGVPHRGKFASRQAYLFSEEAGLDGNRVLFLDLDQVIVGDLRELAGLASTGGGKCGRDGLGG